MYKSLIQSAVAALLVGVAGAAAAGPVVIAGDFKFAFNNYDSATTGYGTTLGTVCATVLACDAAATSLAAGSVGSVNTSADTMGIFTLLSITKISTGTPWYTYGQGGVFLTGVFGNLKDHEVTNAPLGGGAVTTSTKSVGGTFALYENASDYNPTVGAFVTAGVDLNVPKYTGITGGSLWLGGVFSAGAIFGDTTTTYTGSYNNVSLAGSGQGFLDVTGGSAMGNFDTNAQTDPNGNKHDLFLSTIYDAASVNDTLNGWTVTSTGQIKGTALPEPGSLALVALALLGVGAATRRSKA